MVYGIIGKCNEGCYHIVAKGETELDAWAKVPLDTAGLENLVCVKLKPEPAS